MPTPSRFRNLPDREVAVLHAAVTNWHLSVSSGNDEKTDAAIKGVLDNLTLDLNAEQKRRVGLARERGEFNEGVGWPKDD